MNYLHSELEVGADQLVHVILRGHAANVLLLDEAGFERYCRGEQSPPAAGGYFSQSPAVLRPPQPGRWHVVINLAGRAGQVSAAVSLRPA